MSASLEYETSDPYAVQVTFHTGSSADECAVVWTFARQLIIDGLDRPAGLGDVRVWPVPDDGGSCASVALALCSPSGEALFEIPREALQGFLRRTFDEVPIGFEDRHVDMDAELKVLLNDCV
ncbi:MAG: SsgA family sporulation/cell division regulator [Mycobacteriales bacterium]